MFIYLGSSLIYGNDINTWLAKAWLTVNRLLVIWKSDLSNKIKCNFFQVVITSIPLYGCTTWSLTKHMEKKLDGNCTRMLKTILNKSWKQYTPKQQLYGHQPPIPETTQIRRTRHAGHFWSSERHSPVDSFTRTSRCWTSG